MLTDLQKRIAKAIIGVFETGRLPHPKSYGQVTYIEKDTGELSYGSHQATLASGSLFLLIKSYVEAGSIYSKLFEKYLPALEAQDSKLNHDRVLHDALKLAGTDPIMQKCQEDFFDRVYWLPAETHCAKMGMTSALAHTIVFDSLVQGRFSALRKEVDIEYGPVSKVGEQLWCFNYLKHREAWLKAKSAVLARTTYRMEELRKQAKANNWDFDMGAIIRGIRIDGFTLEGKLNTPNASPLLPNAQAGERVRVLKLSNPTMSGNDVLEVQNALNELGYLVKADGVFGAKTHEAVIALQASKKLKADGIVGPATRTILELD